MNGKMKHAPIFYMVAQIRFSPVLDMGDFISGLQKVWRHKYPDFSQQALNQLTFQFAGDQQSPDVKPIASIRWHFKDAERISGYILATDSLIFHTTAYNTSDDFFSSLLDGLNLVNQQVGLSYIEGLGVRSLDAVVPTKGYTLETYIKPNLLGLFGRLEGDFNHSILETVFQDASGKLTSRLVTLKGPLGVSADLYPLQLEIKQDLRNLDCPHIVLDNDCSRQDRISFDLDEVQRRLRAAKHRITAAFNETITPEAIRLWNE
jgi:uncharacterized protein (TIGR04255 family)